MRIRLLNFFLLLIAANILWSPLIGLSDLLLNPISLWVGFGAWRLSEDIRDFQASHVLGVRILFTAAILAPFWPLMRRRFLLTSH